ncbi:protein lin-28 homolog A isoform X1 [Clupea harengus]|uniref:Protein lin-28 homolog A isoform X1 n=1 Tax=Clupea harengus TaxID=7950 RepID=A0A6P3WBB1_CLUHA|nr:protein lin-28 homolog A isoform X1 [Clupea harengus]
MAEGYPIFYVSVQTVSVGFPPNLVFERGGGVEGKGGGEEPGTLSEPEDSTQVHCMQGAGHCKWFNVRMGFGFISMTSRGGYPVDPPVDVFVHQSKLHMEGFRSLKEGEAVEFTFKKSSKGLESGRVTGPEGAACVGSERRPKGKSMLHKRKPKGDRCYNCGGLDHHAKECSLPPQPKKCHYCQSMTHMVAQCPQRASMPASATSAAAAAAATASNTQGRPSTDPHASTSGLLPSAHVSSQEASPNSKSSSSPEEGPPRAAARKKRC